MEKIIENQHYSYRKFDQLCQKKGVSHYKVAKMTGVSSSTLSSWKLGKYTPKQDKLEKIAAYFGVPLDYFMETQPLQLFIENNTDQFKEKRFQYYLEFFKRMNMLTDNSAVLTKEEADRFSAFLSDFLCLSDEDQSFIYDFTDFLRKRRQQDSDSEINNED